MRRLLTPCAVAFVVGAASMVVELASVKALAPYFGASTEIWTYSIGVVLLMLSAGYAVGGVAADRARPLRTLGQALVAAGLGVMLSPLFLRKLAMMFLPPQLSLGDAEALLRYGAVTCEGLIFGFPVFFMGFASPLVLRGLVDAGVRPGRASGLALASSTLGGLLGTFGTTFFLIERAGVATTFLATGAVLCGLGVVSLIIEKRKSASAAAALLLGAGAAYLALPMRSAAPKDAIANQTALAELDSREQHLKVVQWTGGGAAQSAPETWLQVNEGLDSFQSIDAPGRATAGHYYDVLAAAPLLARSESSPRRIAVIGAGTGTVVRSIQEFIPGALVDAVELDPKVLDLGRAYFRLGELEQRGARMIGGIDGRAALRALTGPYDAVLIDAYARQVEIPFHLATVEMMLLSAAKLAPGGVVAINVSSFGRSDPVLLACAATMASAFGGAAASNPAARGVLSLGVRGDHNAVLVASPDGSESSPRDVLSRLRETSAAGASAVPRAGLVALFQFLASPSGSVRLAPAEFAAYPTLTDDRAPMERLQSLSLAAAQAAAER